MSDPTPDPFSTIKPPPISVETPASAAFPEVGSETQSMPTRSMPLVETSDVDLVPGSILAARYEVLERVGVGGMGIVLRVFDSALERELALKVMRSGRSPESIRRFVDEARVSGRLQHPGVVPLHELGYLPDGTPYFTMKLVRGRTLGKLLKERLNPAADLTRFVQVFEQICQAVAYAHVQGVIHRDLKPSNVMVGAFGEVQVMDWGLAKAVAIPSLPEPSRPADETAQGSVLGTPAYMPPEQALGIAGQVDQRSDVFTLGAILCEILTGQPPYPGSLTEAHAHAANGEIGPALDRLGQCRSDGELVAVATACLQPRPEDRPADAAAVATLVSAYLAQVQARLQRAQEEQAAAHARAEEAQARARAERRARRLTLGLAAVGLVLVLGVGGGLWSLSVRQ